MMVRTSASCGSIALRRCVGEGISEYVHRVRVRAACEQMLSPETSLAELSVSTGFADQSHFTRSFRRITGMTPSASRSAFSRASSRTREDVVAGL